MQYLNPREREVVARLAYEKASIITQEQFDRYFKFPKRAREKTLFRLSRKGILKNIKKGVYLYSPLESGPAGSNINEFLIPPVFFPKGNYYIGYSTMYNYYGFTDQLFQVMYILNTSLQREKMIGNMQFKMVKISPKRMYGLEKIRIKNTEVIISDRERTLVDLIYAAQPVGGLKKAFEILKEQVKGRKIDTGKLIRYALKFPNVAMRKRIGFALEQAGLHDRTLEPLLKSIKKTSLITLYPSRSRKGKINRKWMVIENAS
ncbi:MAG: type IV toxin-antitoxin system AbiEi family antitoxin [Nitrospirota bacterium]